MVQRATPFEEEKSEVDLAWLADLLDTRWRIPGTNWRFGIDPIASLFPVVGDVVTGLVGLYILEAAKRAGVPKTTLARMIWNLVLDTLLGSVPVLGTIFDVVFKANQKNLRLLERHQAKRRSADLRTGVPVITPNEPPPVYRP
jgi:hypothetical protein